MAVDSPVLYNNAWVYLRDSLGSQSGGADKQKHNAELFYNLLRVLGYTQAAACGVLGNMQVESGLSPGALYGDTSSLPNNGEQLASLTNNAMLNWTTGVMGLIQWKGAGQDGYAHLPSFGNRYNLMWYDWELQIFRLEMEYIYDPTGWGGVNGVTYSFWFPISGPTTITWAQYKAWTGTPEDAAAYFQTYRERGGSDTATRQTYARNWYTYFTGHSVTIEVSNVLNACMAYLFRDSQYTYSQYDCIHFVNLVRARLGLPQMTNGTNSLWRNVGGNFLWWRGTVQDCLDQFGAIPEGAYLFKCYPEGTPGYERIPDQYRGDGIGNFDHIGIYTNRGLGVMQSGGYDAARTGVADCAYHPTQTDPPLAYDWWTHVAFGNNIYFPGVTPGQQLPVWLYFQFNKRRLLKNARKLF